MFQTKEQNKTPEEELSEVKTGNLPDRVQDSDQKYDQSTREKNGGIG